MASRENPVGRRRDAALVMRVGVDDDSRIVGFYRMGDRSLVIKEGGIYEFALADEIDPDRTNPNLPPTQQRIVDFGAGDEVVQRVLLTADVLLREHALGDELDLTRARELALAVLQDLLAMRCIHRDLADAVREREDWFAAHGVDGASAALPSINDVRARCEAFSHRGKKVFDALGDLVRIFYPAVEKKWADSFARRTSRELGASHSLTVFMALAKPHLLTFLNMRIAVEHEQPGRRMIVKDFILRPAGGLALPTIEVEHPDTPMPQREAAAVLDELTEIAVALAEAMLCHLCAANVKQEGPFVPIGVTDEWPRDGFRWSYYSTQPSGDRMLFG